MTLILMKNKKVLSIPALQQLVLKSIYATKNMTSLEESQMQHSITTWKQHLDMNKTYQIMNAVDEEHLIALQEMAWLITENNEGRLDNRKAMFKEHQIDWRKFHRLPGSITEEDLQHGQEALKKAMDANPEDYR